MKRSLRTNHTQKLILCALFAALLCILSPLSVPLGPVPVSLGLFGVLLLSATLPPVMSLASVAVFLTLGACGLPVFGVGGGATALIGPTGGYLWGYLPTVLAVSALSSPARKKGSPPLLATLLGVLICYACGTLHFCLVTRTPLLASLPLTVLPFLPLDLLKALLAASISRRLRQSLPLA